MGFEIKKELPKTFEEEENELFNASGNALSKLRESVVNQELGALEKLDPSKIENISDFCEHYFDQGDSFVVRASADGTKLKPNFENNIPNILVGLKNDLQKKGLNVEPDYGSNSNLGLAWARALTLLNQLPQNTLDKVKPNLNFDVQTNPKQGGDFRFASIDLKRDNVEIEDIGKGDYKLQLNRGDLDEIDEEKIFEEETIEKEVGEDGPELIKLYDIKDNLSIPLIAKIGNQYFVKYNYYKIRDGKLYVKSSGRRGTKKSTFRDYDSRNGLKVNTIPIDVSKDFSGYENELSKLKYLHQRNAFLNRITDNSQYYAIEKLYENKDQRRKGDEYAQRAENMQDNGDKLYAKN